MKSLVIAALIIVPTMGFAQSPTEITAARSAVSALLKDPSSAKWAGEKIIKPGAICGLVNAKNSYGGYTGDTPYVYVLASRQAALLGQETDRQLHELKLQVFEKWCFR